LAEAGLLANITGPTAIGSLLLLVFVITVGYALYKRAMGERLEGTAKQATAIGIVLGFVVAAALVVPGIQPIFWKKAKPKPKAPKAPRKKVEVPYQGITYGVIQDKYAHPTTGVENATVKLRREEPTRTESPPVLATENTNADGSFLMKQDMIVKGPVWISAVKDNEFYPAKEKTEIPGAGVFPPERLYIKKADITDIGSLSWALSDSSTNIRVSGNTIYENVTTSTTGWIELELKNTESESGLRDLQALMIRGADWDDLGAAVDAYLKTAPDYIETGHVGDTELVDTYTCELNNRGELKWGDRVVWHINLSVETATGGLEHAKLVLDDLLGGESFEKTVGIPEQSLSVVTEE